MSRQTVERIVEEALPPPIFTRADYVRLLDEFDVVVCEAVAVSQGAANRIAPPHQSYGTYVFVGICSAAIAMMRAMPLSRWVRSDFQHWAFGAIAPYARAIIEGHILLAYLMEATATETEWSAKLNVMHLNDCTRRITLHGNIGSDDEVAGFVHQAEVLKARLHQNSFFSSLPAHVQRRCLDGDSPMICSRSEMLDKLEWDRGHFRAIFDLLSQYAHILPISFYRMELNGRGTGLENPTDRAYICLALEVCTKVLTKCTDTLVDAFPDTIVRRKGKKSRFSPGPRGNLPR